MKMSRAIVLLVALVGLIAFAFAHPAAPEVSDDTIAKENEASKIGDLEVDTELVSSEDAESSISVSESSSSSSSSSSNLKFHKNTKIGIIGGGPAGLFAARLLSRAGYKKVTVFERSADGPETIATRTVQGKVMDFTTRYIPSINTEGPGTDPALQEMITQYQAQTYFVSAEVSYVDTSLGHAATLPIPHIFADFFVPGGAGAAAIIGDLIWGFEVLRAVRAASGVVGCYSAIGVIPGTSVSTWAASVARPAFTRLAAYTNDAYLGGPSTSQDICAYLKVRTHFLPGDIVTVLKTFGITNNSPIPMSDALRSCLATSVNARRKLFTNGYKNFFQALVDAEDFDLIAGKAVVSVKHQNDKDGDDNDKVWVKLADGSKYNFNKVIFATRPVDTLAFLKDENLAIQPLLQQTTSLPNVHVHAFQTTLSSASAYPGSEPRVFTSLVYPASVFLGTPNMPTAVIGLNKEYSDSSVVVAIGYANNDGSSLDEQQRATSTIQAFGYTPTNLVFGRLIPYPVRVAASVAASGWYAQVDALQGVADYYHIGEAFSGYGVPRVLEETTRVIKAAFLL